MNRPIILPACATALLLFGNPLLTGPSPFGPSESMAQEDWKAEFDAVCSKTDVAMTLSVGELKDLVARCVRLKGRIETQEESTRKVYLRRLKMCHDLYTYVLENKERDR
jgi:hypothetical protein